MNIRCQPYFQEDYFQEDYFQEDYFQEDCKVGSREETSVSTGGEKASEDSALG